MRGFLLMPACLLFFPLAAGQSGDGGTGSTRKITSTMPWLCYYGPDRRVLDVEGYQLLILEAEAVGDLSPDDKKGRLCVAYMSVGEAERNRWFWPDLKNKSWVLEINPEWPDSHLVDVRSPEWQDLLVDVVAENLIQAGYDGFILDNVDTAEELLRRDPALYAGADEAMSDLIRRLRKKYPDAVIIANGGLSIVPGVADSVDAMMYEGTVSTWRRLKDGSFGYQDISANTRAWLRPRLLRVKAAGLPILALEYADPDDPAEMKRVWDAVAAAGNNPFISTRALYSFPGSDQLPPLPDDGLEEEQ
ncbi:MAG: endo alpha-1,4 polygalactosaminidase [Planctomycetes bacterium]|nr:endo alpha-1,4 polygalactosaminidase [Planctomycetota bacterium]